MKQRRGKPSRLQWIMSLVLILAGLLFSLPVFPEELRRSLPQALFVPGFVVLLVLWRQKEKYDDLPLEERKELDRENRDERNRMIYEKTAWCCWQGETILLIAAFFLMVLFMDKVDFLKQLRSRDMNLIFLLYWLRILIFELARWWMNQKY